MEPFTMMALGGGALSVGGVGRQRCLVAWIPPSEGRAQSGSDVYRLSGAASARSSSMPTVRSSTSSMRMAEGKSRDMSDDVLRGMKDDVNEDYGQGLADMSRIAGTSAVSARIRAGGNVYTPGRYDRATADSSGRISRRTRRSSFVT
jgi:hypothetical protein